MVDILVCIIIYLVLIVMLQFYLKIYNKKKAKELEESLEDKIDLLILDIGILSTQLNSLENFVTYEDTQFYKELTHQREQRMKNA